MHIYFQINQERNIPVRYGPPNIWSNSNTFTNTEIENPNDLICGMPTNDPKMYPTSNNILPKNHHDAIFRS